MINTIDTAVILASGYSKAFDIPHCLLKVHHQTIIKRTVDILRKRNIKEIFIIVGYKKNFILKELENENVNFIFNSNYTYTGTMQSLSLLKKYLIKDFVLIDGHLLFDENILVTLLDSSNPNCISCATLSESGEETFDECMESNRFIFNSRDNPQMNYLSIDKIGISKISIPLFQEMLKVYESIENDSLNYENLMLKCSNVWTFYCFNKNNSPWITIDSNEQYNKAVDVIYFKNDRKISEQTIGFISNYLRHAIGTQPEEMKKIEYSGGMTNKNYKITLIDGNELQIRIPGAGTNSLVNRNNEIINTKAIDFLKINVPTFYFNPHDGVKIAKYVKNAETLSKQTAGIKSNMEKISFILKKLHSSNVKMNNDFSFKNIIQDYESVIINKTNQYFIDHKYPNFSKQKERIIYLNEKIQQLESFFLCPCHNDLVPENFIKSREGKIFLIDWEYSGYNNPFWDLAAFILESELTNMQEQQFLKLYFQRSLLEEEYFQLDFYKAVQDILWSLWTIVKELHGESFGDYGHNRYERGSRLLKGLEYC
ncbi:phosphotransferase [Lysinibacillus xylanilyticus]|uniref:phosphotransferase n=1 Tax=Lysinibacillus xylanilyticus TaxID=582475 RepID=UPI003D00BF2E